MLSKRIVTLACFATLATAIVGSGCSSDAQNTNSGSGGRGTGGTAVGTGGAAIGTGGAAVGTGGAASGTGGAASGTGGAAPGSGGATAGTGGAAMGSGGAKAGTGGSGSGGATSSTGGAGTAGSSGGGATGAGGAFGLQTCTTQTKGMACLSATDVCSKGCGPLKLGVKTETCTAALYVEGYCQFAPGDYSCFKVSATTPACPAGTTTASGMNTCTAAAVCNGSSAPCQGYTDGSGAAKTGYCICNAGKWVCGNGPSGASNPGEWPCLPNGTSTSPGVTGC